VGALHKREIPQRLQEGSERGPCVAWRCAFFASQPKILWLVPSIRPLGGCSPAPVRLHHGNMFTLQIGGAHRVHAGA